MRSSKNEKWVCFVRALVLLAYIALRYEYLAVNAPDLMRAAVAQAYATGCRKIIISRFVLNMCQCGLQEAKQKLLLRDRATLYIM